MKKLITKNISKGLFCLSVSAFLASCAATQTALEYRNLETTSKLSQTVFLNPVTDNQKTIFLQIKNTSSKPLTIDPILVRGLTLKGYQVLSNPSKAHYWLQVNIKSIEKMNANESQSALLGGYGSVLGSIGAGASLGALSHHNQGVLVGGLAGGLVSIAADALIKNVNYTMITDVQISERTNDTILEKSTARLSNGSASHITQTSQKNSAYQKYQTRIVSTANKVNLSLDKAKDAFESDLANTLLGIF